jgi:hypothetical protein
MGALLTTLSLWLTTPLTLFASGSLLYLAWCSLTHWLTTRKLFHLLLGLLLGIASPLIGIAIYVNTWGELLGIAVLGVTGFAIRDLLTAKTTYHTSFLRAGVVFLTVWISLTSLFSYQHYQNYQQRTDERLKRAITVISSKEQLARELAFKLSQEPFVRLLVEGAPQSAALTEVQRFLVTNQLQFITITSTRGTVLLRAHDQTRSGDTILDFSPWVLPALNGEVVSGKAYDERGLPTVSAAVPVTKDTVPVGAVVLGFNLNQNFATEIRNLGPGGIAVGTVRGIRSYSSGSSIESTLYSSAALDEIVRRELQLFLQGKKQENFTSRLKLDEEEHLIQANILSSLIASQPIAIMTIEVDTQPTINPYVLAFLVALLTITLFNLKSLISIVNMLQTVQVRRKRD